MAGIQWLGSDVASRRCRPYGLYRAGAKGTEPTMRQVIVIVACGITLAACSGGWAPSMPSWTMPSWKPNTLGMFSPRAGTDTVQLESEPPGAEARTAQGQSCRTPCVLALPVGEDVAVTFSLNGYQPQTVPLTLQSQPNRENVNERGESDYSPPRLAPNPVFAELVAMPAAKPAPAKKPAAKPTASSKPAANTAAPRARTGASSPFPDPVPPPPR